MKSSSEGSVPNPLHRFPSRADTITKAFFATDVPRHSKKVEGTKKWLSPIEVDPTFGLKGQDEESDFRRSYRRIESSRVFNPPTLEDASLSTISGPVKATAKKYVLVEESQLAELNKFESILRQEREKLAEQCLLAKNVMTGAPVQFAAHIPVPATRMALHSLCESEMRKYGAEIRQLVAAWDTYSKQNHFNKPHLFLKESYLDRAPLGQRAMKLKLVREAASTWLIKKERDTMLFEDDLSRLVGHYVDAQIRRRDYDRYYVLATRYGVWSEDRFLQDSRPGKRYWLLVTNGALKFQKLWIKYWAVARLRRYLAARTIQTKWRGYFAFKTKNPIIKLRLRVGRRSVFGFYWAKWNDYNRICKRIKEALRHQFSSWRDKCFFAWKEWQRGIKNHNTRVLTKFILRMKNTELVGLFMTWCAYVARRKRGKQFLRRFIQCPQFDMWVAYTQNSLRRKWLGKQIAPMQALGRMYILRSRFLLMKSATLKIELFGMLVLSKKKVRLRREEVVADGFVEWRPEEEIRLDGKANEVERRRLVRQQQRVQEKEQRAVAEMKKHWRSKHGQIQLEEFCKEIRAGTAVGVETKLDKKKYRKDAEMEVAKKELMRRCKHLARVQEKHEFNVKNPPYIRCADPECGSIFTSMNQYHNHVARADIHNSPNFTGIQEVKKVIKTTDYTKDELDDEIAARKSAWNPAMMGIKSTKSSKSTKLVAAAPPATQAIDSMPQTPSSKQAVGTVLPVVEGDQPESQTAANQLVVSTGQEEEKDKEDNELELDLDRIVEMNMVPVDRTASGSGSGQVSRTPSARNSLREPPVSAPTGDLVARSSSTPRSTTKVSDVKSFSRPGSAVRTPSRPGSAVRTPSRPGSAVRTPSRPPSASKPVSRPSTALSRGASNDAASSQQHSVSFSSPGAPVTVEAPTDSVSPPSPIPNPDQFSHLHALLRNSKGLDLLRSYLIRTQGIDSVANALDCWVAIQDWRKTSSLSDHFVSKALTILETYLCSDCSRPLHFTATLSHANHQMNVYIDCSRECLRVEERLQAVKGREVDGCYETAQSTQSILRYLLGMRGQSYEKWTEQFIVPADIFDQIEWFCFMKVYSRMVQESTEFRRSSEFKTYSEILRVDAAARTASLLSDYREWRKLEFAKWSAIFLAHELAMSRRAFEVVDLFLSREIDLLMGRGQRIGVNEALFEVMHAEQAKVEPVEMVIDEALDFATINILDEVYEYYVSALLKTMWAMPEMRKGMLQYAGQLKEKAKKKLLLDMNAGKKAHADWFEQFFGSAVEEEKKNMPLDPLAATVRIQKMMRSHLARKIARKEFVTTFTKRYDPSSQAFYYTNNSMGTSAWEKPRLHSRLFPGKKW